MISRSKNTATIKLKSNSNSKYPTFKKQVKPLNQNSNNQSDKPNPIKTKPSNSYQDSSNKKTNNYNNTKPKKNS